LLASLLVAPTAVAKGPIQLCGRSGCVPLMAADEIHSSVRWQPGEFPTTVRPSGRSSFYKLQYTGFGPVGYWVPAARKLRLLLAQGGPARWVVPSSTEEAALAAAAQDLAAFPAPRSATVAVDLHIVRHAETYLRLFAAGTPAQPGRSPGGWLPIFMWGGASPWNDGLDRLAVSRRGGWLKINDVTLRIPDRLAAQVRQRVPLTA
jgi:hypothetical protein